MRLWLLAALLLVAPTSVFAAPKENPVLRPRCGGEFQLCGYIDSVSGAERVSRRFEVAQPFSEGLAAVRIGGRYGFIDPAGRIVIAPRFQAAGHFSGGYAEVRLDGASGVIDRAGRLVVPARFERITPFTNGTFIAQPMRRNGPSTDSSEARLEGLADAGFYLSGGSAGLYDIRKGWLTTQDLQFSLFDAPARGLIWATKRDANHDDKWGLLKSDGTWRVSPRYDHVQQLVEARAIVTARLDPSLPPPEHWGATRWGAVDRDGKLVVPLKFAYLSYSSGGYLYATEEKPYRTDGSRRASREGLVRADGTLLAGRYFDAIDRGGKDRLPRGRIGKTWYSIEPNGRQVPDQNEGMPLLECPGGPRITQHGDMIEFRRADGTKIGRFDKRSFSQGNCSWPFSVKRDGKWFLVREDGSILGGETGVDNFYAVPGNHMLVQVSGAWGIIDQSGKFTVVPRFDKLSPSGDNIFMVGQGEGAYWIDATGARVAKPVPKEVPRRTLACDGGLYFFQETGLWGLRKASGETVIAPRYLALSCFSAGVAWTAETGGNGWCPVGPDGRRNQALECRETFYPVSATEHFPEKFSEDPYESSVLWNRAWLDYQAGKRGTAPRWRSNHERVTAFTAMSGPALGKPIGPSAFLRRGNLPLLAIAFCVLLTAGAYRWRRVRSAIAVGKDRVGRGNSA